MPTASTLVVLLAVAAGLPRAGAAAGPAAELKLQKTIYADLADVALTHPEGVACDERGALVVADTGNARLVTFRWKDGGLEGGAQVKLPQLPYPFRVAIDSKGFVLALDRRARKIVRIDANGAFAGYLDPQGASAPVTPAAFKLDAADNVHVLDVVAGKVVVTSPEGRVIRELALPKGAMGVTDVAVDSAGRVYVVDAVTATVYAAEKGATAFQPLSASLKDMISFPVYLAPDNRGKLYVVDQHGNAIVTLGVDGSFQGRELATGWAEGALYYPAQLCLNSLGDVFVADRNNNRIGVFALPR